MKFIAILRPKDTLSMLPPDAVLKIYETSMAGMEKLQREGKMPDGWASPNGNAVVMLDYDDVEQWMVEQMAIPILNYYSQEIIPVTDLKSLMGNYLAAMKQA